MSFSDIVNVDPDHALSYVITDDNEYRSKNEEDIVNVFEIGRLFTLFLYLIFINEEENAILLNRRYSLPFSVYINLPRNVRDVLNFATLKDFLSTHYVLPEISKKYKLAIEEKIKNKRIRDIPNPTEPVDFLPYIGSGESVELQYILCSISILHNYNQQRRESGLALRSYYHVLNKYILEPAGITTFSVVRPKNGKYNPNFPIEKYINGNPAGGYWMSVRDLSLFGKFILRYRNTSLIKLLCIYGKDFFSDGKIICTGEHQSSSVKFIVDFDKNLVVVVANINNQDAKILVEINIHREESNWCNLCGS